MPSIDNAKEKMEATLIAVSREFATVRTGKATPGLLDTVRVDAYGSKMPINQLATVSAPEASLLVVQPFDRSLLADIERAIQVADLGFNPANDGTIIRIPVPPLNQERRKEYVKLLHKLAEDARVSVRHARQEARDDLKRKMRDHEVPEDEGHRQVDEAQKLTDRYIGRIDELLKHKEEEVMQV
jgi:ribosome recycling factor